MRSATFILPLNEKVERLNIFILFSFGLIAPCFTLVPRQSPQRVVICTYLHASANLPRKGSSKQPHFVLILCLHIYRKYNARRKMWNNKQNKSIISALLALSHECLLCFFVNTQTFVCNRLKCKRRKWEIKNILCSINVNVLGVISIRNCEIT